MRRSYAAKVLRAGRHVFLGETIVLLDALDGDIRNFTYNDQPPWPPAADGSGYSLVLVCPHTNPDHGVAANWRSSAILNGSPGEDDTISCSATWANPTPAAATTTST